MFSLNEKVRIEIKRGTRLIVFVPEKLKNVAAFARQVYMLAAADEREVFYLALRGRDTDDLAVARQLTTLTALTQDSCVRARALQARPEKPADVLVELAQPGDIVVVPEEQLSVPEELERTLGIRQQVLAENDPFEASRDSKWYLPVLFWGTSIAIMVAFFFLETSLEGVMSGAVKKIILILFFSIEIGLLYFWDRMSRKARME
jgi:hypothetical protein